MKIDINVINKEVMKLKKYIYVTVLALIAMTSCQDFLDVQKEGNSTTTNYFMNDQQSLDAVEALYRVFATEAMFGRDMFWPQAAACNVVWGRTRGYNTLATFAYTGDESPLRGVFRRMYEQMSRSNFIIKSLLEKQQSTTLTEIESRSLGEAYFVRGWAHLLIAYRYGTDQQGVPFVRWEDFDGEYDNTIPPQLASVVDNYANIIDDMDNAIAYLPKFEDYGPENQGRPHKAAAVAFKARVYAYWATWDESQWNNVITMVNSLETDYGRALASSFDLNFSGEYNDWWTSEYLWTIPSDGGNGGGGSEFPGVCLENKGWGKYNGWGQYKPSYDIYSEMCKDSVYLVDQSLGNVRLKRSILEYNDEFQFWGEARRFYSTSDVESGFQINKFMDPFKHAEADQAGYVNTNGDAPTARLNFPIMRFAEMKLFRAEAYIMTNQAGSAKQDLDDIRNRSNIASLDHAPTMADVYHERRCELAFEMATDHLFDLKRWNRSSNATIKALADAELNAHSRARHYEDRSNPESAFIVGDYEDYKNKEAYQSYMMVFPYPSEQITKSAGKLKQNPGYN